jgi:gentisate 1,2-dioxygenase
MLWLSSCCVERKEFPMVTTDSAPLAGLQVGPIFEDWSGDARFFEYTRAADPVGSGDIARVPIQQFSASAVSTDRTAVVPLDLSEALGLDDGPATSPALLASFVHIREGEHLDTAPRATSELYYVLNGHGYSAVGAELVAWRAGDFLTFPASSNASHHAAEDTTMYWVTDEPLMRYLGVTPTDRRFRPTKYDADRVRTELDALVAQPGVQQRNRLSVLLANAAQPQTLTATPTLWAMYGVVPIGQVQRAHRHQSVALDLVADCEPGCFSLVGEAVDDDGEIIDPVRVDWEPGGAFVTPPGLWHAHHNESGHDAHIIPIQDAGLLTYLRALDIRFVGPARPGL